MSKFIEINEEYRLAIKKGLISYLCMPFADDIIPGSVMERIIEKSNKNSQILKTYDFIDVVSEKIGWQVKATKITTPITWKRAKIPNKSALIKKSKESDKGCQILGDAIIEFCNDAVRKSFDEYKIDKIFYSRLIVDTRLNEWRYFERLIADKEKQEIFDKKDIKWKWNQPKNSAKKEQLPAFIGDCKSLGIKYLAWHGLGENQLHFTGEKSWHPKDEKHLVRIPFQSFKRLSEKDLYQMATDPN